MGSEASSPIAGGETFLDPATGLMWAAHDNGADIGFDAGRSYAERLELGGFDDWRMPTRVELASLLSVERPCRATVCGGLARLPGQLHLSCNWLWAAPDDGAPEMLGRLLPRQTVRMSDGSVGPRPAAAAYAVRVLPVRDAP